MAGQQNSKAGYGSGLLVAGSLANSGTILVGAGLTGSHGAGQDAVLTVAAAGKLTGGGAITGGGSLVNHGTISVLSMLLSQVFNDGTVFSQQAIAVASLTNAGTVDTGVYVTPGGMVTNTGTIDGTVNSSSTEGVTLAANGIVLNGSASVGTALITGYRGVQAIGSNPTIINDATITGYKSAIDFTYGGLVRNNAFDKIQGGSHGIFMTGTAAGQYGTVLNAGDVYGATQAVELLLGGSVNNTGLIISTSLYGIEIAGGLGTIVNAGKIDSALVGVTLAAGGTVSNLVGGRISSVHGDGVDVSGGAGATLINAGSIGGASIAVAFTGGASYLLVDDPGAIFAGLVRGGTGSNTLELAVGTGSTGTIASLGSQFIGFRTIVVDAGAHWTLINPGFLAAGTILSDSGVLTVAGAISGGGSLVNHGTISATSLSLSQVFNDGTVVSPHLVVVASLTNAGTVDASVYLTQRGMVTNTGAIDGTANGGVAVGVTVAPSGIVLNGSTSIGTALITGYRGVEAIGPGATLFNYATISGNKSAVDFVAGGLVQNNASGQIQGGSHGIYMDGGGNGGFATVVNAGTVTAATQGVELLVGGSVNNSGTIASATSYGVQIANLAGTVVNAGTIVSMFAGVTLAGGGVVSNLAGGTIVSRSADGVDLSGGAGATLINAGTIGGASVAVAFAGPRTYRLIDDPGAVFIGQVKGGTGSDTLELAGNNATGTLAGFGTQFTGFGSIVVDAGAVWSIGPSDTLSPAISVTDTGTLLFSPTAPGAEAIAAAISGTGGLVQFGGTLLLDGADSFTGGVTLAGGTLDLSAGNGAGGQAIAFAGAATLQLEGAATPTGTIYGFGATDAIDLAGIGFVAGGTATLQAGNTLALVEGEASYDLDLDPLQSFDGLYFHLLQDAGTSTEVIADTTPCFCPATLIRTDAGERPVETLAIGDLVLTCSGRLAPIRWIGRRSYAGRFLAGKRDILPVRIAAGALADGVPARDLVLSPLHALLLDGALIPAGLLVNGISVRQEAVDEVHYLHIELAEHDVIWAEGAAAESFVDDRSRGMFHNAAEYHALYPEARWQPARYCAPRLEEGYRLEAIRERISARAGRPDHSPRARLGALRGFIDRVSPQEVCGWAQDVAHPEAPVCLDILVDGRVVAQSLAGSYRPDLAAAGPGSGRHSFAVTLPPANAGACAFAPVEVRRSADGARLPRSTRQSSAA